MTEDARFEDGGDRPLRLMAWDADDLGVLAALAQDAIFPASEMRWLPKERRFAVLLNRFRWEDAPAAELRGRPVERVQALLVVADVMRVRSMGIESRDPDTILSLLDISFTQGGDGTARSN